MSYILSSFPHSKFYCHLSQSSKFPTFLLNHSNFSYDLTSSSYLSCFINIQNISKCFLIFRTLNCSFHFVFFGCLSISSAQFLQYSTIFHITTIFRLFFPKRLQLLLIVFICSSFLTFDNIHHFYQCSHSWSFSYSFLNIHMSQYFSPFHICWCFWKIMQYSVFVLFTFAFIFWIYFHNMFIIFTFSCNQYSIFLVVISS